MGVGGWGGGCVYLGWVVAVVDTDDVAPDLGATGAQMPETS